MADNADEQEPLRKIVNSSGFPLQIAIRHAVKKAARDQKWGVWAEEHPWKNEDSGESGFIDLVLDHLDERQILIVECKRVRDSKWIFLIPLSEQNRIRRARSWTTINDGPEDLSLSNWSDWNVRPYSFESKFCVVPGQDPKAKPMLERIASGLVEATEAFAMEELRLGVPENGLRTYFSAIVTTADLKTCMFDPNAEIDLKTGDITDCQFQDIPFIRFRKSLTTRIEEPSRMGIEEVQEIFLEKERTVFVISSCFFLDFLKQWKLGLHTPILRTKQL
jgi:hypothetical protein